MSDWKKIGDRWTKDTGTHVLTVFRVVSSSTWGEPVYPFRWHVSKWTPESNISSSKLIAEGRAKTIEDAMTKAEAKAEVTE